MQATRYPHRIESVHIESINDELCVYDTARQRVHSLNRTAAFVWQRCDGRTAPAEIATALSAEASVDDAEAVVRLTLQELAAAQLLTAPLEEVAVVSRRDLLRRGVAAAAVPAIYSIVAPSPAAAQSVPLPAAPTLTSVAPNQGTRGTTVAVTLTGTNFVVGATTVAVSGGGVTVNNVVVSSGTSLSANFVLDGLATDDLRAVTVTTPGGTSGAQTFLILLPHGVELFAFTGVPRTFVVPAGVTSIVIEAIGAKGGDALPIAPGVGGVGGLRGKVDATVSVTPGSTLTVRVGGDGQAGADGLLADGGFNGGGRSGERGGGGGGASDVYNGAIPLVIAGGGGGSGYKASGGGGNGGDGGDTTGGSGELNPVGGLWGSGGGQLVGGAGGAAGGGGGTPGTAGSPGTGGMGGQLGLLGGGGGGGGGGYRGGGGGGGGTPGGGGGGGGSSLATPGATHVQGSSTAAGVKITW